MNKKQSKTILAENSFPLLFGKKNYSLLLIGIGLITFGFLFMLGNDANTRPDGTFDPNYFNEAIFSWRRIRLAPLLIISGFVVNIYAILTPKK